MPAAVQLLILLAALMIFWLIVMRPARNQQRTVARLQSELAVGDEVVLSAGIFGTVRSVDEAKVDLEIAPGTVITVARQVVVRRVDETAGPVPPPRDTGDTEGHAEPRRAPDEESE